MKKILLVDDLDIDVMLTRLALDGYASGYQVTVASDGEEALAQLQASEFDLLLLDLKMPRVDGFELLERMQALAQGQVPAIILSGSALADDRTRASGLGVIDYVQKAVDYSGFKRDLRAALDKHGF